MHLLSILKQTLIVVPEPSTGSTIKFPLLEDVYTHLATSFREARCPPFVRRDGRKALENLDSSKIIKESLAE